MNVKKPAKHKKLFQGIGIGYVVCLVTHILAALLPMYIVFPFAEQLFGHGHAHGHGHACSTHDYSHIGHGLFNHILGDLLILTMIIVPVAILTFLGHKLVSHLKCRCGTVHEEDPCESCQHRKF